MVIPFFQFRGPNSWSCYWFLCLHPSSVFQYVLVALIPSVCWELFITSIINTWFEVSSPFVWRTLVTSSYVSLLLYLSPRTYSQSTTLNDSLKTKTKKQSGLIITVLCIQNFNGPCFTQSKSLQGPVWHEPLGLRSCLSGLLSHYFPGHSLRTPAFLGDLIHQACFCRWPSELAAPSARDNLTPCLGVACSLISFGPLL